MRPGPAVAAMPSRSRSRHRASAQRLGDQPVEMADMGARRDLRHDAAIGRMIARLRQHDIGEDLALAVRVAAHHGRRGLVAGGFDAENGRCCGHECR